MNRVQFIASAGKIHEYNFARIVLPNREIDFYSDTGYVKFSNSEIKNYYETNNFKVFSANSYRNIKIGVLRKILNILSGIKMIIKSRKKEYSDCFVHFLSKRRLFLSLFLPRKTNIYLITYGSDILRVKKLNNILFNYALKRCKYIVFNSKNLRYTFEKHFGDRYKDKCLDIPFPGISFERLIEIQEHSSSCVLEELSHVSDKKIIICGHTATHEENYEKIIDAINVIDKKILDGYCFVFFMTYGAGDFVTYRNKIKSKLSSCDFTYVVLENYLDYDNIAKLHKISTAHITAIDSDALSIFMLEELYSGATVFYGKWLNYFEFEGNDFDTISFSDFNDLSIKLEDFINGNHESISIEETRRKLDLLNDGNEIFKMWEKVL